MSSQSPTSGCDVLNLEWASRGRDIDIVEPVLTHLETEHGLSIVRDSIFNAGEKLLRYRPRLLLIADQGGARANFQTVRLATRLGIRVVTLRSEGMYPDDPAVVGRMFWGWNDEHRLYECLHLEWSQRNVDLIRKHIPESQHLDMRVSGATGFDRYKIFELENRDQLLARKQLSSFEAVVGIAGWTFSHVVGTYYRDHRATVETVLGGASGVEMHARVLPVLREELRTLISRNPRIAFLLRFHPGELEEEHSEFYGLDELPNVVFSRRRDDNIADLVSACDVWLAYESTTCLEAWLCNTPTILLNPLGPDFARSRLWRGSVVSQTGNEASALVRTYLSEKRLPGFDEREHVRRALITETIGWADGKNHVRAAGYVKEVLQRPAPKMALDGRSLANLVRSLRMEVMVRLGLAEYSSVYRASKRMREGYEPAQRESERQKYAAALAESQESQC